MTEKEAADARAALSRAIETQNEELASKYATAKLITIDHLKLARKTFEERKFPESEVGFKAWQIYQNLLDNADIGILQRIEHDEYPNDNGLYRDTKTQLLRRKLFSHIDDKDLESVRVLAKSDIINARHLRFAAEKYEQEITKRGYDAESPGNYTRIFKILIKNADKDLLEKVMPSLGSSAQEFIKKQVSEQTKKSIHPLDRLAKREPNGLGK